MRVLKIKENVNLKELEKFGFEKRSRGVVWWDYEEEIIEYYIFVENITDNILNHNIINYNTNFSINCNTREIEINCIKDFTLNILFDLIQAGLVESVEEQ